MANVCDTKYKSLAKHFNQRPSPAVNAESTVLRHLSVIVETFVQMYQQRQIADYDNSRKWGRTDVLGKINSVEAAFQSWHEIRSEAEAQEFLASLRLSRREM